MRGELDRRRIVRAGALALAGTGILAAPPLISAVHAKEDQGEPSVTPAEDLMREHGVLNRVLLIYEAGLQKFSDNQAFDPAILADSGQIVRQFIERYHERNEELYLFPRFRAAGQMLGLLTVLYQQHQAGRRLTDTIIGLAQTSMHDETREKLMNAMRAFIRMYRPHEAREDTELFPKLRRIVSANEYDSMAEDFEREEHKRFGEDGFTTMVERVTRLEQAIGINELARVTAA